MSPKVVVEADAGAHVGIALAVQVERYGHLGFVGPAVDMGEAGHRCVVGGIIGHASFELEALNTVSKEKVTLGYPPCNSFLTASGT